jgi:hypothetical protein
MVPYRPACPIRQLALMSTNVQLEDSGRPSRIVHRLFLLVVPIMTVNQVVELRSGLNDQSRRLHV